MRVNPLTRSVGLKVGPLVVETLFKRYFDRLKANHGPEITQLRQEELLYDATFVIVKAFLEQCSLHTVEDVQGFSNTWTPSPPWVHVVRLLVPISCCDQAAGYLITALGGQDVARKVVGGVKWWQVRGVNGVDAQWIAAKKDWQEAKRRYKEYEKSKDKPVAPPSAPESDSYSEEMDEMRCILYAHGGGYYFGSVDQERYSIQRHARKINGRVFAVNYRLAPQYPFPCALQDLLAAYLFLIQPPPGAAHCPVKPEHIVVAGDSAGGGMALALLQIIRDTGLPQPAGGVLISPWCDLTHSFPSIRNNTATDVIPSYGLCLQKPSTLWPPPSDEMTLTVRASLRSRIRKTLHLANYHHKKRSSSILSETHSAQSRTIDDDSATHMPPPDMDMGANQTISLIASSKEEFDVKQQVQLYAPNSLLVHPLVSSTLSFLGGLPPLLFIAGDKEVLRDEIIYAAHKAAYPAKYPVNEKVRQLYPSLIGIEQKHGPTKVHLQIYDDAAHVLPVLFPFTTPAKFCYRAMATFCKYVTGMPLDSPLSPIVPHQSTSSGSIGSRYPKRRQSSLMTHIFQAHRQPTIIDAPQNQSTPASSFDSMSAARKRSLSRSISLKFSAAASAIIGNGIHSQTNANPSAIVPQTASGNENPTPSSSESRTAGQSIVYGGTPEFPSWEEGMIRERVSTQGVIRPLEPEEELDALQVPLDVIGSISELLVKRYLDTQAFFEKKFGKTYQAIEKHRRRNLERAKKDIHTHMAQLQAYLLRDENKSGKSAAKSIEEGLKELSSSWAWVMDGEEKPPPSSIVSRRDTDEACRLARIADKAVLPSADSAVSGNNLWSIIVTFLSMEKPKLEESHPQHGQHQRSWFKFQHHKRVEVSAQTDKEIGSTSAG